jgi:hypothetical protein
MRSLLSRALAEVRAWVRLIGRAPTPLHPSHGWLLPPSGEMRTRALALVPVLSLPRAAHPSGRYR